MDNKKEQMTLVIGNYNYSSWSFRAWLMLRAYNLQFSTTCIPLMRSDTKAEILKHSSAGKVPVLKYGAMTIWDSLAICEMVNEMFLSGRGWPLDLSLRALGRSVVAEMHSGFEHLRKYLPMNVRRLYRTSRWPKEAQRDIDRIQAIFEHCLTQSAGPYLLGSFSIADCFFAPVVSRFNTYNVSLATEKVKDYCEQILAFTPVQEWFSLAAAEEQVIEEIEFADA